MKSISISKSKAYHNCKLGYKYTYVDRFEPEEEIHVDVTDKGLVMHETFEALTILENYNCENGAYKEKPLEPGKEFLEPSWWKYFGGKIQEGTAYEPVVESAPTKVREATNEQVMEAFKYAMEVNKFPIEKAMEFNLKRGLKRWLSFKHDYLDKRGTRLYAEKRYDEFLFGETKTTTILDLLEDMGDGNYVIYDYKTPKTVNPSQYKEQLALYAYMMAVVKGLIKPVECVAQTIKVPGQQGSTEEVPIMRPEYEIVAKHFKLYVFFPLADVDSDTYEGCLKEVKFKADDVRKTVEGLINTAAEIDAFDFTKSAEVLQPTKMSFKCGWCKFNGSKPDPSIGFEGCPISCFCKPSEMKYKKV